jgi:hypothetical protein
MRVLLRSFDGLMSALTVAGQEIVKFSWQKDGALLELMLRAVERGAGGRGAIPAALWRGAVNIHALVTAAPIRTTDYI